VCKVLFSFFVKPLNAGIFCIGDSFTIPKLEVYSHAQWRHKKSMSNSEKISAGKRAFGERVRQFRMDRDRDWSQDDLARESHLSQSEISKIEKASYSREPSEETIRKIAKAFEIEPVDLARGTPFAALFAQSEVLAVGSRTEGPAVMVYFASALTNLSPEQSADAFSYISSGDCAHLRNLAYRDCRSSVRPRNLEREVHSMGLERRMC
jgi:transcriptional regulator with XRE-family HTH domain